LILHWVDICAVGVKAVVCELAGYLSVIQCRAPQGTSSHCFPHYSALKQKRKHNNIQQFYWKFSWWSTKYEVLIEHLKCISLIFCATKDKVCMKHLYIMKCVDCRTENMHFEFWGEHIFFVCLMENHLCLKNDTLSSFRFRWVVDSSMKQSKRSYQYWVWMVKFELVKKIRILQNFFLLPGT
jgi:hypothetical protein